MKNNDDEIAIWIAEVNDLARKILSAKDFTEAKFLIYIAMGYIAQAIEKLHKEASDD